MRPQALPHIGLIASTWFAAAAYTLPCGRQVLGGLGLLAAMLGSWSASGETAIGQTVADALGPLPASFIGVLPCADCPGIRHQLDLYPDRAFVLRLTYLERDPDNVFDDIGSFLFASDGRTLVLMGGRDAPVRFRVENPDRLRQLDLDGQEIVSELNYSLTRAPSLTPVEPQLLMRGMGGFGGCNRLLGGYRLDGERIELSPVASTMMACPESMDTEQALVDVLGRAATWRVVGEHLELFDGNGALLARFERRLMP